MIDSYSIGDDVIVAMPDGDHRGTVKEIMCRYSFHEETKYVIAGKGFDEKVEKMMTQAKGEVEAFISNKIHSAGLDSLVNNKPLIEIEYADQAEKDKKMGE